MKIALIATCHNRKNKTITSLYSIADSCDVYNKTAKDPLTLSLFLTDDGCTDGTAQAVFDRFCDIMDVNIMIGNGDLYWAGGMRVAWQEALKRNDDFDFFLLFNDDTIFLNNAFAELINAHEVALRAYGQGGLYSGICHGTNDDSHVTYGGCNWTNRFLGHRQKLSPTGDAQECDMTNANILMISKCVVVKMGIFYTGYVHGNADFDYSIQAKKQGFPLLLTAHYCGVCDFDHSTLEEHSHNVLSMSLRERKLFFSSPLNSSKDYLTFIKRNTPIRYPMVYLGRWLIVYFPSVYFRFRK